MSAIVGEMPDYLYSYFVGITKPHYPLPTTIGYVPSGYGIYQIDTRRRVDGMPLFRGYTWDEWVA